MSGTASNPPTLAQSAPKKPAVIAGRFALETLAYRDDLGEIWAAHDLRSGRDVALRLVSERLLSVSDLEQLREACRGAAQVKHANIAAVFGVGKTQLGQLYVASEWTEGSLLSELVPNSTGTDKRLSVRGVYNLISRLCDALHAAHPSLAHGALRPEALRITPAGTLKIQDLGLANTIVSRQGRQAFDQAIFIAPELEAGGTPSELSDIYSAGALMHYMIYGIPPNSDAALRSRNERPSCPPGCDAVIDRCLSEELSRRYTSVEALLEALVPVMGLPSARPSARTSARPSKNPAINSLDVSLTSLIPSESEALNYTHPIVSNALEFELADARDRLRTDTETQWIIVHDNIDHGPFKGEEVANAIVAGEFQRNDQAQNLLSGEIHSLGQCGQFAPFIDFREMQDREIAQQRAHAKAETRDSLSLFAKALISLLTLAAVGLGVYFYVQGRGETKKQATTIAGGFESLYKIGQVTIRSEVGILPSSSSTKRNGARPRRSSGASTSGSFASFEDAMSRAVSLGDVTQATNESTLSGSTIAATMNRELRTMYGRCVKPEINRGGRLGTVAVDLAIAGNGRVMGASVRKGSTTFRRCVSSVVSSVRFPSFGAPRMGAQYRFSAD